MTAKTETKTDLRPILEVQQLTKYFDAAHGKKVHAVENVSFTLERGETLGIVGESGCGKSSMGRTILKIHDSTSGKILFDGVDITKFSNRQMIPYRKRMQMIFQDPYASLNPRDKYVSALIVAEHLARVLVGAFVRAGGTDDIESAVFEIAVHNVKVMRAVVGTDRSREQAHAVFRLHERRAFRVFAVFPFAKHA